ncbi:MAG: RluA family pseudouridine synthase [Pelagibacterales bacterium]|nr:RluA family pseudouridine synthase [Pelagibacterales bacterium]
MLISKIKKELVGLRLDKFLCREFDISFGLSQKIIREKKVKVNAARVDPSYKVAEEDQIEIFSNLKSRQQSKKIVPRISENKRQDFLSWIIFEDENLIAINKPSGMATQGGSGVKISVDDFLKGKTWQLTHRLDKDTSGILLIAKNSKTAEFLTEAFRNKTIKKTYLALVDGVFKKKEGVVKIPLLKKMLGKNEKVMPDLLQGKEAITEFSLLKSFADYSLLELRPLTGRTHQLRVHCKELGHPILNDVKYGGTAVFRKDICKRLCLHAYKIELNNYFGKILKIEAGLPEFCKKSDI